MISKFFTFTASFVAFAGACVVTIAVGRSAQQPDRLKAQPMRCAQAASRREFVASGATLAVGQISRLAIPGTGHGQSYKALINYDSGSMRLELCVEMGATMPLWGVPFIG